MQGHLSARRVPDPLPKRRPWHLVADLPHSSPLSKVDLLHDLKDGQAKSSTKPYECVLPISYARVDRVKRRVVKCGLFIPHIIHELEVQLIASELSSTLLKPVGIKNLQLVLEAVSSPSAREPVDYQRLEFLGDSILKFCTVTQAYSERKLPPCCGSRYTN